MLSIISSQKPESIFPSRLERLFPARLTAVVLFAPQASTAVVDNSHFTAVYIPQACVIRNVHVEIVYELNTAGNITCTQIMQQLLVTTIRGRG